MTREEYIKNLKNQGKVTVKDLAELLTFTLDGYLRNLVV